MAEIIMFVLLVLTLNGCGDARMDVEQDYNVVNVENKPEKPLVQFDLDVPTPTKPAQ